MNSDKRMNAFDGNRPAYPSRKRLNHRGPLFIDVASAWYFITICAKDHAPWTMRDDPVGRDDPIAPKNPYDAVMSTACHFQNIGKWNLALLLVMPDHLHLIANIPYGAMGSSRPTGLECVIRDFKRSASRLFGIHFQRDFFDTRLRDDAHFAEKYNYILGNPVRKGLCASQEEWPYSIAFTREGIQVGRDDPIAPDELREALPTKAQLTKCVADAERQVKTVSRGLERRQ